jgi:hypothetical protein
MLAKRRVLTLNGMEVARTPLLVPSFSSKGFPEASKIIKTVEEVFEGAVLVSAYDLHHKYIEPELNFPSLIFLDSGGYEASKDHDLSDVRDKQHVPAEWTLPMYEAVLSSWSPIVPSVLISYDHPKERRTIAEQIERARTMVPGRTDILREILLKPETSEQTLLKLKNVLAQVGELRAFDIIGVTEKEIGNSIFSRMENIARLRTALAEAGLDQPIHVFGSLDTITTPLYFLAGADIFDGLTWLRYAFHDGYTMYRHNFGALELGVTTQAHIIDASTWNHNYRYLKELELEMRRFLKDGSFTAFKHHRELFQTAYESVVESVGGEI